MRAQLGAVFLLFLNVVGAGPGPLMVASLSDNRFNGSFALGWTVGLTSLLAGAPQPRCSG